MNRSWKTREGDSDDLDQGVNARICRRLKIERLRKSLSQEQLARAIGISYQQLQKYETGKSRLPCNLLFRAAVALDTPPAYFFDGIAGEQAGGDLNGFTPPEPADAATLRSTLSLQSIANPNLRRSLHLLIAELARGHEAGLDGAAQA